MTHTHVRLLIIGAGSAGYTAGIYAARAGLNPVLLTGMQPGGQLTITNDVENYPGFADMVQGPWLMEQMRDQAINVGTKVEHDTVNKVDFNVRPFVCETSNGHSYTADAVVVATGAQAKWLGIPGEEKYQGFGVSACATCDGFFYKNQRVVVIGGGNTAVEEALYMTNHASEVVLVHRRDSLRAEKILQDRLFAHPKIRIIWNSQALEMIGEGQPPAIVGVKLQDTQTGEETIHATDGIFVAIGHKPSTELFAGQLDTDENGYLVRVPDSSKTNIDGVFAAGDVADHVYRQAVTAAGMGCMAALDAEKYLAAL